MYPLNNYQAWLVDISISIAYLTDSIMPLATPVTHYFTKFDKSGLVDLSGVLKNVFGTGGYLGLNEIFS